MVAIPDDNKTQSGTKDGTTSRKRAKPAKIGGYTPVKKIGQGAMGDIWLCDDPSLCRRVVVKQCCQVYAATKI